MLADAQQNMIQDIQMTSEESEVIKVASPSEAAENLEDDAEEVLN
ncbi:hypothetical protein LBYZC6_30560 [Lacrimispora brassicae]